MHPPPRMLARLDIKMPNVIKGRQMEGLRVVGDPADLAAGYYRSRVDEIVYVDVVASLYQRNNLRELISYASSHLFLPLTVVGGVRSIEDAREILMSGADKIGLNTAAINRPHLIAELASDFGSQSIVLSIEAKRVKSDKWEAYTHGGREATGVDVVEWAAQARDLGAGEVFVTSVDQDGTGRGYDIALAQAVVQSTTLPVVISGGASSAEDVATLLRSAEVSGYALGRSLHSGETTPEEIRSRLRAGT